MAVTDAPTPFSFPDVYETHLVAPLFRPWVDDLFDAVALRPSDDILDVGCGTGIVARTAKERLAPTARVVGIDLSPNMLGVARRVAPQIDWREGDAARPPLQADERFDVVVSQQGLQFFGDRPAAIAAMRDALRPGGRLGIATWRPLDELPFFSALHEIAERQLGPIVDQRHSFGDDAALAALLRDAGLSHVTVRTITRRIRFDDGPQFLRLNTMALVGMSPAAKAMSDGDRAAMVATIAAGGEQVLHQYADGSGVAFDLATNLASGRI